MKNKTSDFPPMTVNGRRIDTFSDGELDVLIAENYRSTKYIVLQLIVFICVLIALLYLIYIVIYL